MTALELRSVHVPLQMGDDGVIRVEGTRIPLDTIAKEYLNGATPEEIAQRYGPSLPIVAAYAVIAWCLQNVNSLGAYLKERHELADAVRREVEQQNPPEGIRARLEARRKV